MKKLAKVTGDVMLGDGIYLRLVWPSGIVEWFIYDENHRNLLECDDEHNLEIELRASESAENQRSRSE